MSLVLRSLLLQQRHRVVVLGTACAAAAGARRPSSHLSSGLALRPIKPLNFVTRPCQEISHTKSSAWHGRAPAGLVVLANVLGSS
jgi:hypothetical protein